MALPAALGVPSGAALAAARRGGAGGRRRVPAAPAAAEPPAAHKDAGHRVVGMVVLGGDAGPRVDRRPEGHAERVEAAHPDPVVGGHAPRGRDGGPAGVAGHHPSSAEELGGNVGGLLLLLLVMKMMRLMMMLMMVARRPVPLPLARHVRVALVLDAGGRRGVGVADARPARARVAAAVAPLAPAPLRPLFAVGGGLACTKAMDGLVESDT